MQFPVYIHFFKWTLHPHLVFEGLAYFLGFRLYQYLRYRYGDPIQYSTRWSVITAAAMGAAVGSKLLYWLEDPAQTVHRWRDLNYMMAGKTIVGGLIGGLIAVELTKRFVGERTRSGDLFAAPLCFAIALGRIGCFLTGLSDQTYGISTSLPWGVDFGEGISRHPVQLYESLFAFCLGVLLWRRMPKPHENGDLFKIFMVAYMAFRLFVDFLKPELRFAGLGSIQWACALTLLYYSRDIRRWVSA